MYTKTIVLLHVLFYGPNALLPTRMGQTSQVATNELVFRSFLLTIYWIQQDVVLLRIHVTVCPTDIISGSKNSTMCVLLSIVYYIAYTIFIRIGPPDRLGLATWFGRPLFYPIGTRRSFNLQMPFLNKVSRLTKFPSWKLSFQNSPYIHNSCLGPPHHNSISFFVKSTVSELSMCSQKRPLRT